MDPIKRPTITDDDLFRARVDQLSTMFAAVGTVAGLTGLNYRANAPGGPLVQKPLQVFVTGVKAVPTAAGRAALSFPKTSVAGALAPSPVGYVPGEWLGLHPSVVRRTLGFGAGKKPVVFEASETRVRVFEAKIGAERIAARVLKTEVVFGQASGFPFYTIPAGPLDITPEEFEFLESLPPDTTNAQKLIPELRERRGDFLPSEQLPAPTNPPARLFLDRFDAVLNALAPSASIQPEHIRPVSALALANQAAAEGIRHALVHERADP